MAANEPMNMQPALGNVTGMEIANAGRALVAQNQKLWKLAQLQQGELSNAWDHGYLAGASDHAANLSKSNPYTLDESDLTP